MKSAFDSLLSEHFRFVAIEASPATHIGNAKRNHQAGHEPLLLRHVRDSVLEHGEEGQRHHGEDEEACGVSLVGIPVCPASRRGKRRAGLI